MRTIILFFLFCFSTITGQTKHTIKGNVKSKQNANLIDATVSFVSKNQKIEVSTDSIGKFSTQVETGLVTVIINHFGFIEKVLKFDIKKDTIVDIVLDNKEALLNEVLITNNKKNFLTDLSSGKLSFNMKALSSMPTLLGTTDVIKLLQLTPGVQNSGDANGYMYVRGSDPGHNSILYGETPIYGMSHLLGFFPFCNSDHIPDVIFDKSSSNAKFGGRLSSTLSLVTNNKVPKALTIQGSAGLLASQFTLSVPINQKTGLYFSARKTYIDEVITPILNAGSDNNDVEKMKYGFLDSNLTFISEISKNNLVTVDAFISADKFSINDSNLVLKTTLKWGNFSVSPTLISKLSSKVSMTNAVYFTQYTNGLNMSQSNLEAEVSSFVRDFGFKNSVSFFVNEIPIESGFQYIRHNLQPQSIYIENISSANSVVQNGIIKTNELSFFSTAKPKLAHNLIAELGLRMDYYNSSFYFQPRLVLNYYLNNKSSAYFSFTKQYQYLHLITTSTVGIPTDFWMASFDQIQPQESEEFSIGSNYNISKSSMLSFGSFYRLMKNLLEYPYGVTQFNEMSTIKNDLISGKGKAYGLEMMISKTSGKFKGWLSYTWSWSDRNFHELNNGKTYLAKYDRRHNLSLVVMYELNSKWNFGITQIVTSGNRFTMPTSWYFINNNPVKEYSGYNNAQMPNYIRTDLSLNYFFIKNAKKESAINFSIYNTFNIENPIYIVLNVDVNKDAQKVVVNPEKKVMYQILPSISWKFKF